MKTCVIYGKGPSFRTGYDADDLPDMRLALNEAGWHVPGVDAMVCADSGPAQILWPWCLMKRIPLICSGSEWDYDQDWIRLFQIPGNRNWEEMSRKEAVHSMWAYTEGYSSTVAGWWAWLCGCTRIVTYGVGGEGYHPLFEGKPGNPDQGRQAVEILEKLCRVKGMELVVR